VADTIISLGTRSQPSAKFFFDNWSSKDFFSFFIFYTTKNVRKGCKSCQKGRKAYEMLNFNENNLEYQNIFLIFATIETINYKDEK
jgi:hypothetical protein